MSLTAKDMVGVHLLDLVSLSNPEIASFGNTSNGAYIQWYHNNSPDNSYYVGYQKQSFNICSNVPLRTSVGIGTTNANANATLHVHGTLMTSNISTYNPDNTILFNRQSIGGINNITFAGNLYQGDALFKTSQWETVSPTNIYFPGNVGVGGTAGANSNLFVVGDVVITGQITAQSVVERNQSYSKFSSISLYSADGNGYRRVETNATNYANRVLFSMKLQAGRYMLSGTIPYKDLSPMLTLDTFNWAYIGLYKATPVTLSSASKPICTMQLNSIGSANDSDDADDVNISWFVEVTGELDDYVIAVYGKGHTLQFGPYFQQPVRLACVPVKALGTGDRVDVRHALQAKPIRKTLIANTSLGGNLQNNRFNVETDGYYNIESSNIDIYYTVATGQSARKLYYISDTQREYFVNDLTFQNNRTYATISFTFTPAMNSIIDAVIWLDNTADTYFEAGYLYQNFNISSIPWQLTQSGDGVRLPLEKCVIDGDLFVKGSIWGGCNTSTFVSGGIITDYFGDFEQSVNIVNTLNISDKAVTVPKLDLFLGNVGIGTSSPPERLMVMGNIAPALNNTYNLGTSSLRWKDLRLGGQLISTVATGTAPLSVQSTTVVTNLNAALLEGNNAAFYRNANNINAGILPVQYGGTGAGTLATNKLLVGAGTGMITAPTNLHWDSGSSRLGIGTATPQSTLHVNGGLRVQDATSAGVTLTVGTNSGVAMSRGNDTKLQINPSTTYSDVIMYGNIGIGMNNPNKPLTVQGEIRSTTNMLADLQFLGTNGTASSPSYSWVSSPSTGIYSPGTNTMSVATNGVERLRVLNDGNIGIGTTNPKTSFVISENSGRNILSLTNVDSGTSTIGLTMGYDGDNSIFSIQKNKSFANSLDGSISGLANAVMIQNNNSPIYIQNTNFGWDGTGQMIYGSRPMLSAYVKRVGGGLWPLPSTVGQCNIVFNTLNSDITPIPGSYSTLTGEYTVLYPGRYYIAAKAIVNFVSYFPSPTAPTQTTPIEAVLVLRKVNATGTTTTTVEGFGSATRELTRFLIGETTLHGEIITYLNANEKLKIEVYGSGRPRIDMEKTETSFTVMYLG